MKNLLRIFVLLLVVAAVVGTSMFLMGENDKYIQSDGPQINSGELLNSGDLEEASGDDEILESGDMDESGDLSEVELVSGEKNEKDNEANESGETLISGEIIECSGENISGELAE